MDVLPLPSSYVQVMVVVPDVVIGKVALLVTVTVAKQLSVAVGAVNAVTEHSAVIAVRVVRSGTGAVTSVMITS